MKIVLLLACILLAEAVKLPSNFRKCNRKDPDWKKCVFKAGKHGLKQLTREFPEINLPNLEPFFIPQISINAGRNRVQFVQNYFNSSFFGLTQVDAKEFSFDFKKKIIVLEGTFPEIVIRGKYSFNGKVLLLPIVGDGDGETNLVNLHCRAVLHFTEVPKKGKTFINITSAEIVINPGLVKFRFDNLFNGDKRLGDNVNQVLNENWKDVFEDVRQEYTLVVEKIFISLMNRFFSKVSIEEAFD